MRALLVAFVVPQQVDGHTSLTAQCDQWASADNGIVRQDSPRASRPQAILKLRPPSSLDDKARHGPQTWRLSISPSSKKDTDLKSMLHEAFVNSYIFQPHGIDSDFTSMNPGQRNPIQHWFTMRWPEIPMINQAGHSTSTNRKFHILSQICFNFTRQEVVWTYLENDWKTGNIIWIPNGAEGNKKHENFATGFDS